MRHFLIFLSLCLSLCACDSAAEKPGSQKREQSPTIAQNLETFADSLVRLDKYLPANIEKAGYYFQQFISADSTIADSASIMLLTFVKGVVDTVNQKMWKDTLDLTDLVYSGGAPPTEKQKAFRLNLQQNHINLQGDGEGGAVATLDYAWFNQLVQSKTSSAVDGYLSLVAAEETEPTLMDAGLAIELKELVSRAILSEQLGTQKLAASLLDKTTQYHKFYMDVLSLGSINTPSLEDEVNMKLAPEFKEGYDYLLATYPGSKTAEKIKEWLEIVKKKDRKKLETMKAAQYQ